MYIYRVNGITIDEEKFRSKIIDALNEYQFATIEQLTIILKAKAKDIVDVLDNIIISFIKENPGKAYASVCTELHVRAEFIERLISEGRIELRPLPLEELRRQEELASQITKENIKELQRKDAIRGLQGSMTKTNTFEDKVIKLGPRFYTNDNKRR